MAEHAPAARFALHAGPPVPLAADPDALYQWGLGPAPAAAALRPAAARLVPFYAARAPTAYDHPRFLREVVEAVLPDVRQAAAAAAACRGGSPPPAADAAAPTTAVTVHAALLRATVTRRRALRALLARPRPGPAPLLPDGGLRGCLDTPLPGDPDGDIYLTSELARCCLLPPPPAAAATADATSDAADDAEPTSDPEDDPAGEDAAAQMGLQPGDLASTRRLDRPTARDHGPGQARDLLASDPSLAAFRDGVPATWRHELLVVLLQRLVAGGRLSQPDVLWARYEAAALALYKQLVRLVRVSAAVGAPDPGHDRDSIGARGGATAEREAHAGAVLACPYLVWRVTDVTLDDDAAPAPAPSNAPRRSLLFPSPHPFHLCLVVFDPARLTGAVLHWPYA
ncbi:hypothetical protein CXG81DRAFT_27863 [Caulochytrium protostelioides]|uniref:Uncharacterized protein n=1 Tax=Caulochytrium protostelioides TaxID=1555241 RepID=A0A4P9X2Z4_9FUNG|nr:hypothetical protein CXG81DRAFT_27863 [Caulochytrium protostelioides]|eukprot:RKO99379.1 hypothetical protein CXG81DRAFT_27863 [Caulochytrium protostelioides]